VACNRSFRRQPWYDRYKTNRLRGKTYESERDFALRVPRCSRVKKHEYLKPHCANCDQNKESLKNELSRCDDVQFVFCGFETTQDTKFSDKATEHLPILVYLQQFCTACETQDDMHMDCARCGRRLHSFFEDPVGDLLSYCANPDPGVKTSWR